MPAYVTHSLFGRRVYAALGDDGLRRLLALHGVPFELGLQGPDLLFFYGTLPPALDRTPNRLGSLMHREKPRELFAFFSRRLLALRGGPDYPDTLAYVMGFCCHYCLDSAAHPYVYYEQERMKKQLPGKRHAGLHNKLESDIDSEMFRLRTGRAIRDFAVSRGLAADRAVNRRIARLYAEAFSAVYGRRLEEKQVERSVASACRIACLVMDRPWAYRAARALDLLAGGGQPVSGHLRRARAQGDALNLRHAPWRNLSTGEASEASYPELEDQALERAAPMLERLWNDQNAGAETDFGPLAPFDNGSPA